MTWVLWTNPASGSPPVLTSIIIRVVNFSQRFAIAITAAALIATLGLGWFVSHSFKINTDVSQMMSPDLGWRKRELEMAQAFPQKEDLLVVVVDGDTPDAAENAANLLTAKLVSLTDRFTLVERPDSIPFFRKNGLLFLPPAEEASVLNQIVEAQPMLGMMTTDPSLRGFLNMIGLMAQGVQHGQIDFNRLERPFNAIADTISAAVAGKDQRLAWQKLQPQDTAPTARELRKYILTKPILDYSNLEPGSAASSAIRSAAEALQLTPEHGVRVRLTGSVALNDEEFASVASGTGWATVASIVMVFVILLIALRSLRIVLPILLTLTVGLVITTAFALLTIGSLNLISVAFAVMFIGIAVDFGIQFGVRYRDQHFHEPDHRQALLDTAEIIAQPLAMAAVATAIGFLAFIPTDYRGVSELGLIAGFGMIIAFILNVTLLPALLSLSQPPAEKEPIGYDWAAPIDRYLRDRRRQVLILTSILAVIAIGITTQLRFDFDPINLKDPRTESVSTLFDLMKDPDFSPYTINILTSNLTEAQDLASKLQTLPEVDHVMTLASFIPDQQEAKLAQISDTKLMLGPTLDLPVATTPADDDTVIDSMTVLATALHDLGVHAPAAEHLAHAMDDALAGLVTRKDKDLMGRLNRNLVDTLQEKLMQVKEVMNASVVTVDTISDDLRHDWITTDGRALLQVFPKGNPRDHRQLTAFTTAVQKIAPNASGAPISIQESGQTVSQAFIHAGCYAVLAIAFLAWVMLRSITDVARLIAPFILAGVLTLATITVVNLPLNYANIIALPLLLSLGVSYAIYFVSYWRAGSFTPLQSSMARAVLFSAATVLVAFGSLALSSHPGTSGMGELLTVALVYSVMCTFFVLPSLLGYPKLDKD